jgi:hypothetical protein
MDLWYEKKIVNIFSIGLSPCGKETMNKCGLIIVKNQREELLPCFVIFVFRI